MKRRNTSSCFALKALSIWKLCSSPGGACLKYCWSKLLKWLFLATAIENISYGMPAILFNQSLAAAGCMASVHTYSERHAARQLSHCSGCLWNDDGWNPEGRKWKKKLLATARQLGEGGGLKTEETANSRGENAAWRRSGEGKWKKLSSAEAGRTAKSSCFPV